MQDDDPRTADVTADSQVSLPDVDPEPKMRAPMKGVHKAVRRRPQDQSKTKKKYDWDAIKKMYVQGVLIDDAKGERSWPSLEEVAQTFDATPSVVRTHSARDRWQIERSIYQGKIRGIRERDRAEELSREAVDLDTKGLNTAKLGLNLTMARLADIGRDIAKWQQQKTLLEEDMANGLPVNLKDLRHPVYHVEMLNLSRAAQSFHELGQRALGENVQRVEVTGQGGEAIQHEVIDVRAELLRDDPDRISKLLLALKQTNVMQALGGDDMTWDDGDNEVEEAELVE